MERDAILPFADKYLKMVLKSNFILNGWIEEVYSDSLLFRTETRKSLIAFEVIAEIIIMDGDQK
jgi:hypothetical protein